MQKPNTKIPRILFWPAILLGSMVWALSIMITQLPRNVNSFQVDDRRIGTTPLFGLQDGLMTGNGAGMVFTNFKQKTIRKLFHESPDVYPQTHLYWHQKQLLYSLVHGPQGFSILINKLPEFKTIQRKKISRRYSYDIQGWYIDTTRQQIVTMQAPFRDSSNYILLNYKDSLWNTQREDTLVIVPSGGNQNTILRSQSIYQIAKVGTQYYYAADKFSTNQQGIFRLKKIDDKHYRDTLLMEANPTEFWLFRTENKDTLLTSEGINIMPKPPFLPDSNILARTHFISYKDNQVRYFPRYRNREGTREGTVFYLSLPNQRYLKWHRAKESNYSTLSILDKTGKVLIKNTVTIPYTKYSVLNCMLVGNEIIYFEGGLRLAHARFDLGTLQRVGLPKFWPDLREKVDYSMHIPATKNTFFMLVLLALLGLPFICLFGFRSIRSISRQRQLFFTRLYLVISILAVVLESSLVLDCI